MESRVGPHGEIVIAKEIRDKLGVESGWIARQRLVGNHLEVRFIPSPHDRSLRGSLAPYITKWPETDDWDALRDAAWEAHVLERWGPPRTARTSPPAQPDGRVP